MLKNYRKYRRIFSNLRNLAKNSGNSLRKYFLNFCFIQFWIIFWKIIWRTLYSFVKVNTKWYRYFRVESARVNVMAIVTFPFHSPPNEPKKVSLQKLFRPQLRNNTTYYLCFTTYLCFMLVSQIVSRRL